MTKLQAFWTWLKANWKIPLILLGLIIGWLLFRRYRERGTPLKQTKVEIQAIEAAGLAQAKEAELGAAQAKAWVEANYQAQLNALNDAQKEQARELQDNPSKLAAFLVRAGSGQ